jgi:hypothetical protein
MQDSKEQEKIREQYAAEPGKGHMVEQLMGERENALDRGDDATVIRVEDQLEQLGYKTPEQRTRAAQARKEDAERRAREAERIEANRGPAAARDDAAGGPVEQKAGVVTAEGDPLPAGDDSGKTSAKKQAPAGRTARGGKQEKG